jgi:hypothetical protein
LNSASADEIIASGLHIDENQMATVYDDVERAKEQGEVLPIGPKKF